MSYSASKLAVRDSFDDEDISDDVEDEVFIRDGRNGFKLDEERGVKRPLMAPRRKFKSNNAHNEMYKTNTYKVMCVPCCYGVIALAALLSLIMLVVFLVLWFPMDQMAFWTGTPSVSVLIPCTDLAAHDIWTKTLPKLTAESAFQLNDINKDGVPDVIIGYGTGADGHDIPDFVCTLYFNGVMPCLGGILALDGQSGETIWQHWAPHTVYSVDCGADLTGDGINDCLATGQGGVLRAVNGHDGSLVWKIKSDSDEVPAQFDVYAARFVPDVNGDGVQDVLAVRTMDAPCGQSGLALCGQLVLVSGSKGKVLQRMATPGGEESYYAPQLLVQMDGETLVVFGTGGHASRGGLYVVPLQRVAVGDLQQVTAVYSDAFKGVLSPPVLADINCDGSEDIVAATFNSSVLAFDGRTLKPIWNYSFPGSETFSVPVPGLFNDDDVPDFLVKYQTGPGSPVYFYTQTTVLDGRTGVPLLDKMLLDTMGSQMAGLSISMEGLGNDLLLHWTADCAGHEGARDPYGFMPGGSVHAQSRADVCNLRFNSSLVIQQLAFSQHLQPPGTAIYTSEQRRALEYSNSINTSEEVRQYLDAHPDFRDVYGDSKMYGKLPPGQVPSEKKDFNVGVLQNGGSNFRHKEDESLLSEEQHKDPGYLYPGGEFSVINRGRNRQSGNREEQLLPGFPSNSEFLDVRKHGGEFAKHPSVDQHWHHQWKEGEGLFDSAIPSHDLDYDMLSGDEGYGQRDERRVKKRDARATTMNGIQRLTSTGVLAPALFSQHNDSIDVIFATYWIPPSSGVHVLLAKQLKCVEKKLGQAEEIAEKYSGMDQDAITLAVSMDCLGHKLPNKRDQAFDLFNINMGQMTVYRLRFSCQCRTILPTEKCSGVLPFSQQSWPTGTGIGGNGYFKPRCA